MNEFWFYWVALGFYVPSSLAYIGALCFGKVGWKQGGTWLASTGLVMHSISLGLRWAHTGHGPYISTYEILSSTVWITVLFFLLFVWWQRKFDALGALMMPLSFLMMGFALLGSREAKMLPPSLRSAWLVVHIVFAKLCVAALLVAVALSVFYLLKTGRLSSKVGLLDRLPSPAILDEYNYRMVGFGFVAMTIMIITGIIWGNYAWGAYWSWDPAQTWSLLVWLIYGIFMHGRMTFGWKGTVSAWYAIWAFVLSVLAFFVVPYFVKGLHSQYMVG